MKVYGRVGFLCLWIHAWFWELSRKDDQAHEKSISCFGSWVLGVLPLSSRWNWCGCRPGRTQLMHRLGTRRSGVGMRRHRGFLRFLLPPLRRLMHARSWTCSVSRCRPRSLQQPSKWCFQLFGTSTCLRRERPSTSLREYFLDFKRDASTSCKCQMQLEGREILPIRHVGLTTSPSSLFRVGSMRPANGIATRLLAERTVVSCR